MAARSLSMDGAQEASSSARHLPMAPPPPCVLSALLPRRAEAAPMAPIPSSLSLLSMASSKHLPRCPSLRAPSSLASLTQWEKIPWARPLQAWQQGHPWRGRAPSLLPYWLAPNLSCTSSSKKPVPPSNFPHRLFSLFLYVRRDLSWPSSSCPWHPFPPAPPPAPWPAVASGLTNLARALLAEDPLQGTIVASPGSCSPTSSCAHGTFP
jgi:hypothetical protein